MIGPSDVSPDRDEKELTGSETVLVVEDSDVVRELTVRVLRERGYTVLSASDGSEALAAAAAHEGHIDLLITDLVMPGMSGATLGSRMASLIPGIKVLYVSGYLDRGGSAQELVNPSAAWLRKPFPPQELARKVREVIGAS